MSDRRRVGGEAGLVRLAGDAAAAGVHLIQIREKDLEGRALRELVVRCVAAVRGTRTRVLVNDRFDVAIAAGAHGVHLPAAGVPARRLRAAAPPGFIIGRSVHRLDEAIEVSAAGGLDYLLFGAVFGASEKPIAGVPALREIAAAVPIPVLSIGGITLERVAEVGRAGAGGLAAIGLFAEAAAHGRERLQTLVKEASLAFDTRSVDT